MHFRSTFASALLLFTATLHADIIMEQKMESPYQNATMTMRIKGDKMRTDVGTQMSSIIDIKTGDSLTLMHDQKMAMKMSGAEMKANMEAAKKLAAQAGVGAGEEPKIKATGKTEKVGDYNCTVYTYTFAGGSTTMWVSKDFPNYAAMKTELAALNKMPGQTADMAAIDGMVVKTVSEAAGMKTTTTLVSLKQAPVDEAIFAMPAGYKENK